MYHLRMIESDVFDFVDGVQVRFALRAGRRRQDHYRKQKRRQNFFEFSHRHPPQSDADLME